MRGRRAGIFFIILSSACGGGGGGQGDSGADGRKGDAADAVAEVAPDVAADVAAEAGADVAAEAGADVAADLAPDAGADLAADVAADLPATPPADAAPDADGATEKPADAPLELAPSNWTCHPPDGGVGGCTASGLFDLGALPGSPGVTRLNESEATDINDAGDILMASRSARLFASLPTPAAVWVRARGCAANLGYPMGIFHVLNGCEGAVGINARSSVAATDETVSENVGIFCNGSCAAFNRSQVGMTITSAATAINDLDQVVVVRWDQYIQTGAPSYFTYLWNGAASSGSSSRRLDELGTAAAPTDINNAGQIVGARTVGGNNGGPTRAFLWQDGNVQDLGTLGGTNSVALAINASGRIIGDSLTSTGAIHAFWWEAGTMHDLGTLGGSRSSAIAINAAGQIAGISNVAGGQVHGFFWDGQTMHDLGTLGGSASVVGVPSPFDTTTWQTKVPESPSPDLHLSTVPTQLPLTYRRALNDAGQVVGTSVTASGDVHGFVWKAGTMRDLGTLSGHTSNAAAINASGWVVGTSDGHGYLYEPGRCP